MSAFKDTIAKDIKSVFINIDEFADEHSLNGKVVRCVVDKDLTMGAKDNMVGVFMNAVTIYVAEKDIEKRPVEGALLELDDETYTVRNVSAEDGMLVIIAEAYNQ